MNKLFEQFRAIFSTNSSGKTSEPKGNAVKNITATQAMELIKRPEAGKPISIIDVRTPREFTSGHLRGAKNIDMSSRDFNTRIGQLDKSKTYLVYCHVGGRSSRAASVMQNNGFNSLYNLSGGIVKWSGMKLPVE